MSDHPILFAYDGSGSAKVAISQAAEHLQSGRRALVLTVWEPLSAAFIGGGVAPNGLEKDVEIDARQVAEEGTRLAREAGFEAEPAVERGEPIWQRILEVANERDVGIVVMGSAGRTGISRVLIGSVAGAVVTHSDRPVLIAHVSTARGAGERD